MKIAYFDCIAGASGDMILGALLDAGLPQENLRKGLNALKLDDFDLQIQRVVKNGFSATKVDVIVADDVPVRHLPDIEAIIQKSDLPASIKNQALTIFQRMGAVEAEIHGVSLDQVHLHELGGVDTIVDVVGALLGLNALGVERIYASPLPMGRGFVRGAHGQIPLPAPATLALLKGAPIVGSNLDAETVTPTGAALLTSLAVDFGPIPTMNLTAIGYGAGGRDLPIPNILRLLLGDGPAPAESITETLTMIETNLDDQNPETYDYVMTRLFDGGALDVFLAPIQMKKNRPATLLRVLCRPTDVDALTSILFAETTTLGVRKQSLTRYCLPRALRTVETPYGPVQVKVARWGDSQIKAAPEYEDCRRLAQSSGVPLREVYRAAERAAESLTSSGGSKG
jgi:uncharacterized protein (TIGR00299 family) protein